MSDVILTNFEAFWDIRKAARLLLWRTIPYFHKYLLKLTHFKLNKSNFNFRHMFSMSIITMQRITLLAHLGRLIVLGFNDTSTLVGHFVSSPREREKRDRRDSREDEREGQGRKRKMDESEEIEVIKHSLSTFTCCEDSRSCPIGEVIRSEE